MKKYSMENLKNSLTIVLIKTDEYFNVAILAPLAFKKSKQKHINSGMNDFFFLIFARKNKSLNEDKMAKFHNLKVISEVDEDS